MRRLTGLLGAAALLAACATAPESAPSPDSNLPTSTITLTTPDGVTIHGEPFLAGLDDGQPLILLFHQGGSNGRAEYGPLTDWLNSEGYRAIAWDQRQGGSIYGGENRTVNALPEGVAYTYCDAYPDLERAVDYALEASLANEVIVWGSSYSAALVFQLAAKNPGKISALVSASPASGDPMKDCLAKDWLDAVTVPMFVMSPQSEMERNGTQAQAALMRDAGATYHVALKGVHGSSMLVDERTKHDMSADRAVVMEWLKGLPD
ncbi:MAG: alpha/beta fold hydrolase [Pseudomonadota bacterium]